MHDTRNLYLWNMKAKTEYISKLIRNSISSVDSNAIVILYDSRARGDERIDSDWDILILTDYLVNIQIERKFRDELYDLELECGESFSVFVYSNTDWRIKQRISPFYQNVTEEGILL